MNKFIYKNFNLDEKEEVIRVVRQSKYQSIAKSILPVILIIVPFFFLFALFSWGLWGMAIFFITVIAGIIWLANTWVVWYFKVLVITNNRIVDIDQQTIFKRTVSDITFNKIKDVIYRIKGFSQTLTRVGDILILLTDDKTKIEFENIFRPQKIQQLILQFKNDGIKDTLNTTKLSAQELLKLVQKIKTGIDEEKFKKIVDKEPDKNES